MKRITLLTLLIFNTAWATKYSVDQESCTPVDVRDHHPQLKEHLSTPQDQDSIGWCYGYAAADLLSVETGEPVSAIHVSSIFNKKVASNVFWKFGYKVGNIFMDNSFDSVYEGGFIKSALEDTMKNKTVCSDKDLPYYTVQSYEINGTIRFLESLKKSVKDKTTSELRACNLIENQFDFLNDKEELTAAILKEDLNISLEKLIRDKCQDRLLTLGKKKNTELVKPIRTGNSKVPDSYPQQLVSYMRKVNATLSKGKPLGISYNVKHVTGMNGLHASTVLARRWHNGRCEYKIRNSWGRSCSYREDVECNYSEGSFWVDDEKFFKMANSLTLIDD